jgi:hypothetical protein
VAAVAATLGVPKRLAYQLALDLRGQPGAAKTTGSEGRGP